MAINTSFEWDEVRCTCDAKLYKHQSGRCADAILHRLAYQVTPEIYPKDTEYFDGMRYQILFDDDYLYENENGEKRLVPHYTSEPADAFKLFVKWGDMGGTGRINMNMTGWSATFDHGNSRSHYWGSHRNLKRSRLEWLTSRKLAWAMIKHLRDTEIDECDWLEGVDPIERNPSP